jgi:hypothetical protein
MSDAAQGGNTDRRAAAPRDLPWWRLLALVLAYLVVIQGGGRPVGHGIDSGGGAGGPAVAPAPPDRRWCC